MQQIGNVMEPVRPFAVPGAQRRRGRRTALAVLLAGGLALSAALAHEGGDHEHTGDGTTLPAGAETLPTEVVAGMVDAARRLLAAVAQGPSPIESLLGFSRDESLRRSLDDDVRTDWQYVPGERAGLTLGRMSAGQRQLAHGLLTSALSSRGYLKVMQIMQLDEILRTLDTAGMPRTLEDYTLAIFNEPSMEEPWGWRFEGHHVSINVTVVGDRISVTPSFLGANPGEVRHGPLAGLRPLGYEEDIARELVQVLPASQRDRAILDGDPPADILSGTAFISPEQRERWRETLRAEGIAVAELQGRPRDLVRRILIEVVTTYHPEISATYLNRIDLDTLSFAWVGSTEPGQPHYYRLMGDDFVFEYDNVQDEGNHVHTVWRDRSGDFGEDLLERHYRHHH